MKYYTLRDDKKNTLIEFWYGEFRTKTEISIHELFNSETPYFKGELPIIKKYPECFMKVPEGDLPDSIKYRYNIISK